MHTFWKGNISFGLLNISVKLHSAVEDKDIKFKNLQKDTLEPIKQVKTTSEKDIIIADGNVVKGYEYAKDKYVVIDDSEIQELKNKYEAKNVEVVDFIKIEEIDPIYFNNSYYLSPEDGHKRAYSLLRRVLTDTNKVGIAKITMRSNQQLAVIRTYKKSIILETIHFPDEVRPVENVPNISEEAVDERELSVAKLLIEQLTVSFDPTKYQNEYRSDLMTLINAKIEDDQVDKIGSNESEGSNLMDMLQASIEKTKKPLIVPSEETAPRTKKKLTQRKATI